MSDEDIIKRIRLILGNVDEEVLPDAVILMFLEKWKVSLQYDKHPERLGLIVYNTVIDCVRWIIIQEVASGESSVTKRMEKIGDETISVEGGNSLKYWKDLLDWLLANPDFIDPDLNTETGLVVIGGVRRDRRCAVKSNPNSISNYDIASLVKGPCSPSLCGRRKSPWCR